MMAARSAWMPALPRYPTSLETFSFGFERVLLWLGTAPAMSATLAARTLLVWISSIPNYTTYLLWRYQSLARDAALRCFFEWISVPTRNAVILTDLIDSSLTLLGIETPVVAWCIGFLLPEDLLKILQLMKMGSDRICRTVPSLRTFSRIDEAKSKDADIREGIESAH